MDPESRAYTIDQALSIVGFGRFQAFVLVYAGFGWLTEAMEVMILSFVGPVVKSLWDLSGNQESLLSISVFAGMLVGAYSWGFISDIFGRRKAFVNITFLTTGAGILSAFSPNFVSLVILQFLVGVGLGGGHVFLSWFLEFVPTSHRGTWMVVLSMFWTLGSIFEASLAWIVMPRLSWRWLIGLSTVPSCLLLIFYSLVPESPRYLCLKDRKADAYRILKRIGKLNQKELPPGELIFDKAVEDDEGSEAPERVPLLSAAGRNIETFRLGFASLFSPELIRTTLLLWTVFFGNTFAYYGIVLMTSELSRGQSKCGAILHPGLLRSDLYANVFVTSLAEVPGLVFSAFIVDKLGRKLSMAIMFTLSWIALLPLFFQQTTLVTTALLFVARMFSMGTFTVACIYAPELYPTAIRSTGAGTANAMGRIGGMMCPLVAVALVTSCRLKEAIILFEVVIGLTIICILLFPLETSGRDLKDSLDVSEREESSEPKMSH